MTNMTKRDAVEAAMSVAEDIADGRLDPSDLQHQAVAELRELFGSVTGPEDPVWPLHCDVARQAVALGALGPDELREWAVVLDRQQTGEPLSQPEPAETMPEPVQPASEAHSPEAVAADADPEPVAQVAPAPVPDTTFDSGPQSPHRPDRYDPLRGWDAGGTRHRR